MRYPIGNYNDARSLFSIVIVENNILGAPIAGLSDGSGKYYYIFLFFKPAASVIIAMRYRGFLDIIVILDDNEKTMSYPGGKGGVYQKLINLIPPHDVFIETHLGGGSVLQHKKPARLNIGIDIDPKVIKAWSGKSVRNIEFIRGDGVNFLKDFQFTGKEFVYCDPPYLIETRRGGRLYDYEYTVDQHKELLETIKTLPCMVMISGYSSKLYMDNLNGWSTISFQACTRQGTATEWVWMNYQAPAKLHDYRYLGDTFRERERIKRKTHRWITRLETMPILERHALQAAISVINNYGANKEFFGKV